MERELWPVLYRLVREVGRDFSQKYVQIQPWVLVAVSLWAILHDRPAQWATDAGNWGTTRLRPWRLPSPSTMSRRAYEVGVGMLWRALEVRLRDCQEPALVAFLDGKPLPVGGSSKLFDEAARAGYQLVVPIEQPNAGKGHHYQSPHRQRCIEMMRESPGLA